MAETTITGLPNASTLTGNERVPMDQLGTTVDASTLAIAQTLPDATTSAAGKMSAADKTKLDSIATGAEVNVNGDWNASSGDAQILNKPTLGTAAALNVGTSANNVVQLDGSARLPAVDGSQLTNLPSGGAGTDLSYTANTRTLSSSTGADVVLPEATTSDAGLMASADKTKLDGVASGAEVNANDVIVLACSDETTALTTGSNKVRFRMPFAATLLAVRASVNAAPTGSTLIVDINEAGTSVLGTKLSIDASETTSTTAASAATITDSSLADDAEISVDIDQIGSTVAGAGLKVTLVVRRS